MFWHHEKGEIRIVNQKFFNLPRDEIKFDSKVSCGQKKNEHLKLIKLQTYQTLPDIRISHITI